MTLLLQRDAEVAPNMGIIITNTECGMIMIDRIIKRIRHPINIPEIGMCFDEFRVQTQGIDIIRDGISLLPFLMGRHTQGQITPSKFRIEFDSSAQMFLCFFIGGAVQVLERQTQIQMCLGQIRLKLQRQVCARARAIWIARTKQRR